MADYFAVIVDDTSPAVAYYPFGDTFSSPNLTAGWNPYYTGSQFASAQGETGNGTSLHITAMEGASLSIDWTGTGVQLFGNTTGSAYFTASLDGQDQEVDQSVSDGSLVSYWGLQNTNHTVTLTVQFNDTAIGDPGGDDKGFVAFDRAVIFSAPPVDAANPNYSTEAIPDSKVAFMGKWTYQTYIDSPSQNASMHLSTTAGDSVSVSFQGAIVTLTGLLSPAGGSYSVTLDNGTAARYSSASSFTVTDGLLFYATGLAEGVPHTVVVRNDDGSVLGVAAEGFSVTGNSDSQAPASPMSSALSTSSPILSRGIIAAIVLASVLTLLLVLVLAFYLLYYRPRSRRCRTDDHFTDDLTRKRRPKLDEAVQAGSAKSTVDVLDIVPSRDSRILRSEEEINEDDVSSSGESVKGHSLDGGEREKQRSSVDFNLDPAIYTDNFPPSPRSPAPRTPVLGHADARRSFVFDWSLPMIFRPRSPSQKASSTSSLSSKSRRRATGPAQPSSPLFLPPSPRWPSRSSLMLAIPSPTSHVREDSRQLLLSEPDAPADDGVQEIELTSSPRASDAATPLTAPPRSAVTLVPSPRLRTPQAAVPRVSYGPRERSDRPSSRAPSVSLEPSNALGERRDSLSPQAVQIPEIPSNIDILDDALPLSSRLDMSSASARDSRRRRASVQFHLTDLPEDATSSLQPVPITTSGLRLSLQPSPTSSSSDVQSTPLSRQVLLQRQPSGGALSFLEFSSTSSGRGRRSSASTSGSSPLSPAAPSFPEMFRARRATSDGNTFGVGLPAYQPTQIQLQPSEHPIQSLPVPVSSPTSPQVGTHPFPSPSLHIQSSSTYLHPGTDLTDALGISPTESIPMTVSDIHFRQAESEPGDLASRRASGGSALPPHPPLPDFPSFSFSAASLNSSSGNLGNVRSEPRRPGASAEAREPLSASPFIVQRVLGLSPLSPNRGVWSTPDLGAVRRAQGAGDAPQPQPARESGEAPHVGRRRLPGFGRDRKS